jgi:hypothetical protein
MAVNDVSGTLGYHGLAGAVALSGVVTAAVWIRRLDQRARLPQYALWLFLVPAACAAAIAAFSSGPVGSILAALAVVLTVGAVLVTKELPSAVRVLIVAALIAFVAALIADRAVVFSAVAAGAARFAHAGTLAWTAAAIAVVLMAITSAKKPSRVMKMLSGAAYIALGAAIIAVGATENSAKDVLFGAGIIVVGPASIAWEALVNAGRFVLFGAISIAIGAGYLVLGAVIIADGGVLGPMAANADGRVLFETGTIAFGAGCIALGAVAIGPRAVIIRVRRAVEWWTKVPRADEGQEAESGPEENEELHADRDVGPRMGYLYAARSLGIISAAPLPVLGRCTSCAPRRFATEEPGCSP